MYKKRLLFIFDFDHTIVHDNTDTFIWNLLPNKQHSLPQYFKSEKEWNKFMRKTLQYYYHIGITIDQLKNCLQQMELTQGFQEFFDFIRQNKKDIDCAIVSDSNTFFIDSILEKKDLKDIFIKVVTNPVDIVDELEISLWPYHKHNCDIIKCPKNMCKKIAISENFNLDDYNNVCYFGDGTNDFCPARLLKKNDTLFVRKGYSLEKILEKESDQLECSKFYFESGLDCINQMKIYLS